MYRKVCKQVVKITKQINKYMQFIHRSTQQKNIVQFQRENERDTINLLFQIIASY